MTQREADAVARAVSETADTFYRLETLNRLRRAFPGLRFDDTRLTIRVTTPQPVTRPT